MKFLKKIPMAVSAISLSLAALGNLLLPYGTALRYLLGILSAFILCIFILKLIFDSEHVKEELKNPIVLSILPTSTMTVMLLCTYIKPFIGSICVYIWYIAIFIHVLIMLFFIKRFILNFKLQTVFPSWLIISAGIVVASVTSPAMENRPIGKALFYLGFILFFITIFVIIYRMIKVKTMPEPARPTIAIFTAPMSLCLAGYLSAFEEPNALLVYIMLSLSVICYLYVLVNMIPLIRLKFYPTYAAFTFPFVISAIAFKSANAFLVKNGYDFFLLFLRFQSG